MPIIPSFASLLKHLQVQPAYGWVPDPHDERDEDHEFSTTPSSSNYSSSTGAIDNSRFFKPVSNQLHLPSCTANAGADLLEAVDIKGKFSLHLAQNMPDEAAMQAAHAEVSNYSRLFLWWNGRNEMDPPQHKNADSGCHNRLIMDVASRFGVCAEVLWPYNEDRLPPGYEPRTVVRPSLSAYRNARGRMTSSYHAITGGGDERLDKIVKALQATPGVLFGTALGPDFGGVGANVAMRPSTISGRHAMVIVAWDPARKAFKVRNSWGTLFGVDGYCWMHEGYIAWSGSSSFWVCTRGVLS